MSGSIRSQWATDIGKQEKEREVEACPDTKTPNSVISESARPRGLASLQAQTRGSARVDVTTATDITIKDKAVHKIPLSIYGPLGEDLSALLLGRSSTTSQGLFILPGVIDADFTGQIQAMVWTPSPPVYIPAGSRIAQLIPFKGAVPSVRQVDRFWIYRNATDILDTTCSTYPSHINLLHEEQRSKATTSNA